MNISSNSRLLVAAAAALAIGVTIYLVDRQADVYFVPEAFTVTIGLPSIFGAAGQYLPSALHVYAFILLSIVCLPPRSAYIAPVCASWLAIECLFEFGQHPALQDHAAALVPAWFDRLPILEASGNYFINGSFDPLDLLAAAVGCVAAWLTIRWTQGRFNEDI